MVVMMSAAVKVVIGISKEGEGAAKLVTDGGPAHAGAAPKTPASSNTAAESKPRIDKPDVMAAPISKRENLRGLPTCFPLKLEAVYWPDVARSDTCAHQPR